MVLPAERYPATDHDPNASLIRMVKAVPSDSQDQPFYSRWIYLPKACTVVAVLVGPDTTPASTHYAAVTFPATANIVTTFSGFFRAGSRTQGCLFVDSAAWSTSNQAIAIFDLPSASVIEQWNCKAGVRRINNGLLQGWLIATSSTTVGAARALGMAAVNGNDNFDGAGGTIETWGWQVEPNAGYPSSYMPTTGAVFTRAPDYLTTSDLSFLDPANGTLVFDGAFFGVLDGGMFAFSLDDGADNGIGLYKVNGSGSLTAYSGSAGGTNLGLAVADGQRFRGGIAWSRAGGAASACVNVLVRSLTYWPRRLSDAELQAATAPV